MPDELSDEELYDAARGDLNVLAVLMFAGSTVFAFVSWWLDTIGWIAVAATVSSALATSVGLFGRNEVVAAFVKVGFGFSGLAAPFFGVGGVVLGLLGFTWGWALVAGAVLYFGLSVLGLEILDRAEAAGVITAID